MKQNTYICVQCFKIHVFPESDKREKYFCSNCGCQMRYVNSKNVDEKTGLIVERYIDENRMARNPRTSQPIVECPYCHSTNTQKITTKLWGVWELARI